MDEQIEKLKSLMIVALQEAQDEDMETKNQIKKIVRIVALTILPVFIYLLAFKFQDRYFETFSGRFMYISQNHYFGFPLAFVLDLPLFLPPIIWAVALWFCLKTRQQIENQKTLLNYFLVALITLDSIFFLYSIWFLFGIFII